MNQNREELVNNIIKLLTNTSKEDWRLALTNYLMENHSDVLSSPTAQSKQELYNNLNKLLEGVKGE